MTEGWEAGLGFTWAKEQLWHDHLAYWLHRVWEPSAAGIVG